MERRGLGAGLLVQRLGHTSPRRRVGRRCDRRDDAGVGTGFFQLLREVMSRIFGDQFPYLIPLGVIFIVMIIFLPQGLLGFARRWLNK